MAMYTVKTPTRDAWQKLRDGAKVPRGAVAKVSIGDRIADVHKTWSYATASKCTQALDRLVKDLTTYKNGIRAKYPRFVSTVDDLIKGANEDLDVMRDVLEAKSNYYGLFSDVDKTWSAYKSGGGRPIALKDIAAKLHAYRHQMFSFARIDDSWMKTYQQVTKAANVFDEVKQLRDGQIKYMDDLMKMLKTRKV